jgi:hypothetical protein
MMGKDDAGSTNITLISSLLGAGKTDTVYRDVYFERARRMLEEFLPHAEYRRQQYSKAEIDNLLRQVAPALEHQEWVKVKELTTRMRVLQQTADEKRVFSELAREIYDSIDVPFNPFDPGLRAIGAFTKQDSLQLRDRLVTTLLDLEKADRPWRDFYAQRRVFFQNLILRRKLDSGIERVDPVQVQQLARSALENRDISALEQLAEEMLNPKARVRDDRGPPQAGPRPSAIGDEPNFTFAEKTLSAASRLGLVSAQTEPSREFGDYLQCCCAWNAKVPDRPLTEVGKCLPGCTCGHACPPAIAAPLRETLDLLMLQPFINSAGVRYLPRFISERFLVEDFPENENHRSGSELLAALGLGRRTAICRLEIDQALLLRGPQVIANELGLNSREFRLVCIPFDLYSRLAPSFGWAQKKLWTHFDGFQIWKGARLRARSSVAMSSSVAGTISAVSAVRTKTREP